MRQALIKSETEEALVAHRACDVDAQVKDYSTRMTSAMTSARLVANECHELRASIDEIRLQGQREISARERAAEEMVAHLRSAPGTLEVKLTCA